jgi:hypothetical protein
VTRQINPAAVREFVAARMQGYFQAVADRRETEWLAAFDEEIDRVSRGWESDEAEQFSRIALREFRAFRLEMRLSGSEAVFERYGVSLPARPATLLVAAGLLVLSLLAAVALAVAR